MEKLKIFISGTQEDLQQERKAVADAIRALGHEPVMAENFGAQPMPSLSAIREMIHQADVYVGLYGARYGWKMDSGVSVTEFEFNEFRRNHPDRILTYIKEVKSEPEQEKFLKIVQDFKEGYFRRPKFKSSEELGEWIRLDLSAFIAQVVKEKFRGIPESSLIHAYLDEVVRQKPFALWNNQTYLDRSIAETEELFPRELLPHRASNITSEDDEQRYHLADYDQKLLESTNPAEGRLVLLDQKYDSARFSGMYQSSLHRSSLENSIKEKSKLILLGEPGMGKTTSLLYLAWKTAQTGNEVPIYFELKYYEGGELETSLAQQVNSVLQGKNLVLASALEESTRILKEWLIHPENHFLLLLDGLNEVRPEYHLAVRGAISRLLNSRHHIVISCRERDYDSSLGDQIPAFVLQGLDGHQARNYFVKMLGDKGSELFDTHIAEYWSIDSSNKMLSLVSNPLLLRLICVIAQNNLEIGLPRNRGKLIQQFVKLMPRDRMSNGMRSEITFDIVLSSLYKLAFEMQKRGRLSIDLGESRDWDIPTGNYVIEDVLTQAKDWRMLKSDGRSGEPVEFLHQLFLEYFAAQYLKEKMGDTEFGILNSYFLNYSWHETIVMLAGIINHPVALVKWLCATMAATTGREGIFLVKDCWETSDAISVEEAKTTVVNMLVQRLKDPDGDARWIAVELLEEIGDPRTVDAIIDILGDENAYVRALAVKALGKIGDIRSIYPLLSTLTDEESEVWRAVPHAVSKMGGAAVEPFINGLRSGNKILRWRSALVLGEIGDKRAVEPLVQALEDSDNQVRIQVARALADLRDSRAVEPLFKALRDSDDEVRKEIIRTLIEISEIPEPQLFANALNDSNEYVRNAAAFILGYRKEIHSINLLCKLMRDSTRSVRFNAAWALSEIGIPAIDSLIRLLGDSDSDVRRRASWALSRISMGAVEQLIAALENIEPDLRCGAAFVLGEIGDLRAVSPLNSLAQNDSGNTSWGDSVPITAREAIQKIRRRMENW